MAKYRAAFIDKQLQTVQRTDTDTPKGDTILEGRTGETIWASFDAANDTEAKEKAERLQLELQTGRRKDHLGGADPARSQPAGDDYAELQGGRNFDVHHGDRSATGSAGTGEGIRADDLREAAHGHAGNPDLESDDEDNLMA